jgi:ribonuclease HII
MRAIEQTLRDAGMSAIAGVDEAGRGPCAGPLVVVALILKDPFSPALAEVRDSKELTSKKREKLYDLVLSESQAFSIVEISSDEIDRDGLHKSNLEGFRRAVSALEVTPDYVLTDGYAIEGMSMPTLGVWKGDQVAISISAASIIAKVYRDRIMAKMDLEYPGYGFASHKGYSAATHMEAIRTLGVTPIHRKSFANVAEILSTGR